MATESSGVSAHYGSANLAERILAAAVEAGITTLTPAALAPVDEFHTGGLPATRALAEFAGLKPGERVIDLGCGIGGPSRVLASEFGCDVTGIDLTPEFVEAAQVLTERCGLAAKARFDVGDALALPYGDATFDAAWTQHVVMNINDRATFYAEAARVLKPGGRLVFFDLLLGDRSRELEYPLPWARTAEISFLYTADETRGFLSGAGLTEEAWLDVTESAVQALRQQAAPGAFSLQLVMGEDMTDRIVNVGRQISDGRIRIVRGLFRKPG